MSQSQKAFGVHVSNILSLLLSGRYHSFVQVPSDSYYRVIIEYGCVVWDRHLQKDQILLENIQRFTVKVAIKNCKNSSPSLPTNLHLPPLTNHRTYFKLVCTYKFLYGYLYCPPDFLNLHPNPNLRIFYSKQLIQPLVKTVSQYHSFFISAVRLWNSLPRDIVLLDSLSLFKSSLKLHLCI